MYKSRLFFIFLMPIVTLHVNSQADTLRDPSAPLSSVSKSTKKIAKTYSVRKYILSSVFIGEDKKIAVINGKEYKEGDDIGRYQIKEIEINEVLIKSSLATKRLRLYPIDKTGFIIR